MRVQWIKGLGAIALVAAAAGAVSAQQGPPKPAGEMSQLAFFEGTWSCDGKTFETPMGPAGSMKSTAAVRKDLGGFFQTGTIKGTSPNMPPFEGRFNATYDPAAKQFVMLWVDNMGGRSRQRAAGRVTPWRTRARVTWAPRP
jgi:hypothetical protein